MRSNLFNHFQNERYWRTRDTLAVIALVLVLVGAGWVFTYGKAMEKELARKQAEMDLQMCLDPELFAQN